MLIIDIRHFLGKEDGETQRTALDDPMTFEPSDHLVPISHVTGKVMLMKLPQEINVQIRDITIDLQCVCQRCLVPYVSHLAIPLAEREFLINVPKEDRSEDNDEFFVNRVDRTISLFEMLRQEILLHSPAVPVCLDGCKGLCQRCGKNLNDGPCECSQ